MKTASALDERIKEVYGESAHLDGITNLVKYKKTDPKILWILKEMNNPENESLHQREFHKNKNLITYKYWKNTYKRIVACSYGIIEYAAHNKECGLEWLMHYNNIPSVNDDATVGGFSANVMDRISIINVNKCSGGGSSSNPAEINRKYQDEAVKNLLKEQIEQIEPDIIINCSRVYELTEDLIEVYKMQKKRNCDVYYSNFYNKLLIHYYHPGATADSEDKMTDERYYNDIMKYYKWWIENRKWVFL